jgi:cell division protein FtsB
MSARNDYANLMAKKKENDRIKLQNFFLNQKIQELEDNVVSPTAIVISEYSINDLNKKDSIH